MKRFPREVARIDSLRGELDDVRLMIGRQFFALRSTGRDDQAETHAYRVFSQFGEDGILDYILCHLRASVPRTFIEIGVEDYRESNTRYLCEGAGWGGLIVDADDAHVRFAMRRMLTVHRGLRTVQVFLTRDNVDGVITAAGFDGEVGVLSIDVDGVDLWLARSMTSITPGVVIVEHNPYFGSQKSVTVPYEEGFVRRQKHPSGVYYGASIRAWCDLWEDRGYRMVAVSPEGLNVFFVRSDLCQEGWPREVAEAFRRPSFSPYLRDGVPASLLGPREALGPIVDLPLHDLKTDQIRPVGDLIRDGLL